MASEEPAPVAVSPEREDGSQGKEDDEFKAPPLPPADGFEVPSAPAFLPKVRGGENRGAKVQGRFILKRRGVESKQPISEKDSVGDNNNDESLNKAVRQTEEETDSSKKIVRQTEGEVKSRTVSKPAPPYVEPKWSARPSTPYQLEVIKGGRVIEKVDLTGRPFTVFGRTRGCDVELEHPSISRFHAVVQCRALVDKEGALEEEQEEEPCKDAFFVYDLGSTHGTVLNKELVRPRTYYRVRLGHMLRFGGSSRMFVLVSGDGDQSLIEADAVTEERQVLEQRLREAQRFGRIDDTEAPEEKEDNQDGISWGFQEDAVEEENVMEERPDFEALAELKGGKESYFEKDPKKALKAFFEREGLDMEFDVKESGPGSKRTFTARVQLPIQSLSGAPVYGEASVTGKKRDAILAAALDACRLLDSQGMLREHISSHKRKKHDWAENDYYDSDEDTFLDRTGTIERKRQKRMQTGKGSSQKNDVETYESLKVKLEAVQTEKNEHMATLEKDRKLAKEESEVGDSLDAFMTSLKGRLDSSTRTKLIRSVAQLKKEELRLEKLIAIAAPTKLPELVKTEDAESPSRNKTVQTRGEGSHGYGLLTIEKRHQPQAMSVSDEVMQQSFVTDSKQVQENVGTTEDADIVEKECVPDEIKAVDQACGSPSGESSCGRRILGPAKPPPSREDRSLRTSESGDDNEQESTTAGNEGDSHRRKRKRERQRQREKKRSSAGVSATVAAVQSRQKDEIVNDPDVASWLPPQDQSGDGRTKLNEKFGY